MAQEKTPNEKPKRTRKPKAGSDALPVEQITELMLVHNKNDPKFGVQAVSEIDKDGKAKTVPADEKNENSFLKFDKNSSILENFIKNFWSQLKEPTHFRLLRMTYHDYKVNKQAIRDLSEGKQTDAVKEFLKRYEIRPRENKEQSKNEKETETMAKKQKTNPQEQAPQPTVSTGQPQEQQAPRYRYDENMVNWDALEKMGVSKTSLEQQGLLDSMLKGYKTNKLVPLTLTLTGARVKLDARLSFITMPDGQIGLGIHGIRKEPELERPYFGHIFTEEDKKNLLETGNMGRVVELKNRNGEYVPSFVSIDKLTNEVVAMKAENVFIPREISGVELTEQEQNDLREGKKIFVEGMTARSGNPFDAHLQVNAERRGVEFIFENDKLFNRQYLGGVELTKKQIDDLNGGKAIFVEGMKRKDGELFSSYVKLDEATGRPSYTRYNPDSPEGAREIYIPNEINGVKITPEEQKELREGKPIFLNDMVNRKGEEFSSFIKADLETGRLSYSRTPDGFEQREDFKIPTKVWDVELTRQQRADLQSGKAVLVEGIKGYDGKTISQYVKANFNQGRLDFYNENPDRKRDPSQRNVVANSQRQEQGNRKSKGASIA